MSEYRDRLLAEHPEQVAKYDECCAKAGAILAAALVDLWHEGLLPEQQAA